MISGAEFTLFLIYLAIGLAITISVDALAIALIDEDVYGVVDHAPTDGEWGNLFWKSVSVVVSPLVLTAYAGTSIFIWMRGNRQQGNATTIFPPEYRQIVIEASIDADVFESKQA